MAASGLFFSQLITSQTVVSVLFLVCCLPCWDSFVRMDVLMPCTGTNATLASSLSRFTRGALRIHQRKNRLRGFEICKLSSSIHSIHIHRFCPNLSEWPVLTTMTSTELVKKVATPFFCQLIGLRRADFLIADFRCPNDCQMTPK